MRWKRLFCAVAVRRASASPRQRIATLYGFALGLRLSMRHLLALPPTPARRDAGDLIAVDPLVPPDVERDFGSARHPGVLLDETQIRRALLAPRELDLKPAGCRRTARCFCEQNRGPRFLQVAH